MDCEQTLAAVNRSFFMAVNIFEMQNPLLEAVSNFRNAEMARRFSPIEEVMTQRIRSDTQGVTDEERRESDRQESIERG